MVPALPGCKYLVVSLRIYFMLSLKYLLSAFASVDDDDEEEEDGEEAIIQRLGVQLPKLRVKSILRVTPRE